MLQRSELMSVVVERVRQRKLQDGTGRAAPQPLVRLISIRLLVGRHPGDSDRSRMPFERDEDAQYYVHRDGEPTLQPADAGDGTHRGQDAQPQIDHHGQPRRRPHAIHAWRERQQPHIGTVGPERSAPCRRFWPEREEERE